METLIVVMLFLTLIELWKINQKISQVVANLLQDEIERVKKK